eukprot:gnl/Spiro4/13903_TR7434_c0_g1_i1.p2 gnl/Spiro4/13903_TR7434_c0_g1~~gnl/Spiro4/13903_TR7434_c0_g1_i1.p2  ORF type:complete len:220 (+),score=91.61 gnl/Spiro4/13903_TR7434_c0_g1_i1:102-761(+)
MAAEELNTRLQQCEGYVTDLTEVFEALPRRTADAAVKECDAAEQLLTDFANALATAELDASEARSCGAFTAVHRKQLKALRTRQTELQTKLQFAKAQHTRHALIGDAAASKESERAHESAHAEMAYGRAVMADTTASLERTAAVVADSRALGAATLVTLGRQNQQIAQFGDDLKAIDTTMVQAEKTLRRIGRRMAQDKCLGCMTAAVVGLLIFILIKKV